MLSGSGCGPIYTQPNTIVVAADPTVSQQPIALQNVCQNSAPQSLSVSANGGLGTFLYQWYSNTSNNTNGTIINGANSSTYSPSTSVVGTTYYYCIITQVASGCSVTSSISRVNVLAQPSVVNQPVASQSICVGGSLSSLSTSVTGGVGTPTYQWFSSSTNAYTGTAISNATSNTYSPSNAAIGTTYYYCLVSYSQGSCNSVNTSISTVSVYGLPSITTQPNDYQEVCVGSSGVLSVNPAMSGGNMSVQWFNVQNNQAIAGATSTQFITPIVTAVGQINYYYAVISWSGSGCGSITSNNGSVKGIANPIVTITPSTTQVCQDQQAPPFTSNVSGGFGTTNYQWYYSSSSNLSNGQIIPGATSATYFATTTNPDSIVIATIGSGATETSGTGSDPIDGYAASFRYQVIYTQAELAAAGVFPNSVLKKLGWSVSSDYGSGNLNNYTIKLAQTTNTNSAAHDNSSNSGTIVYSGSYNPTVTAQDAFDLITFQTNYVYQGGNLLVDICSTGNTANTLNAGRVRTMATSTTSGSRYLRTIASCSSSTTTVNSTKPQIQFAICNPSTLYYYVQITQTSGCSVTSSAGTLNIIDAPFLNSSSLPSQTICVGGTITPLTATYSNSAVAPSVQWYSNTVNSNTGGQLISNATNHTYTPMNATVGNMYYYAVLTFSNLASCNVLTTGTANIQILADPQITLQPLSMSSCVSSTTSSLIQFTTNYSSDSSAGNPNVQWNLNGIPVIGANSNSYNPAISSAGTFNYTATVSQSLSGCSATSNVAVLTVIADPSISVVGATSYSSCINEPSPNLAITVSGGSGTISYQWYQNTNQTLTGTPIAGETNSSYLPPTSTIGTKYYYCIVTQSGANCSATSSVFSVTTTALPTGVDDAIPATVQLCQNSTSTTLQVGGGTAYTWYRNSTNSYYGATVIGTNSASYSPSTSTSGTYYYFCVISLSAGSCGSLYSNISAVTVNPQPSLIVQPLSQSGCINFTPNALIVQVSGGNTGYGFQWYSNSTNTNSGGVILSGQTSSSYIPPTNQFGTKYYYCIVTNLSTGCSISSSAGSVFVRNNPTVVIPSGNVEVCEGESVLFLATGASTYTWSNSIMNGTSTINYSQGAYTVIGTDIYGCSANASFSIIVQNLPVVNAGPDIYICPNVPIVLSASGALTYAWSGGVVQNQPFMPNSGYYNVTGTGNFGCTDSDVVYVEVSNAYNPTIVGSITPTVYGGDGAINISVGTINNPCTFDWSNDGLGDNNDNEDIENLNSGSYSVFVTDAIGCEVSQTFTVNEGHELFIPTAISPNGDGYNDSWQILGLSQFDSYEINVFNSQGILVFHRANGYEPWDGTFGSNPLSGDDYVFIIDTKGTDNHIVGYLTITY
jgi:gliding motility-associated-like protein